ncbi:MAG: metallophosphoesterase family protein [Thermoguttaceae bacterium]|nr:metallophosphoesterase family protein [Thermoguttaceae bacterium]
MKIVILADIHANVTALNAVLADLETIGKADSIAILGDLVNYGPRPNETIEIIRSVKANIMVNLWGNHEYSIFGGSLDKFATDRGRATLRYTNSILSYESRLYLDKQMNHSGFQECDIDGKKFLFIHGNLDDPYWGKLGIDAMNDEHFARFDYVISAHSHVSHYVEQFFPSDNAAYRNKKRTVFINPGSVGQPRNHNIYAQYGILDTQSGNYERRCVWYDVTEEQKSFSDAVDVFYKERLAFGI